MSRRRSELRDKAYLMWDKSGRSMPLVEIAKRLGLSAPLIRKWKHEDAWDARPSRKRGGQPGNQNAVGNKGGAPPGNKNGWKNGMYESMWMSQIAIEHKLKLMKTETDPRQILVNEIFLLEYREFKMMGYIKQIEEGWDASEIKSKKERFKKLVDDIGDVPTFDEDGNLQTERKIEYEMIETELVTKTPQKLERLLAIENALSTVQGRKLRCIALLDQFDRNELTVEELELKVERMRLEVKSLKDAAW
ncbi:phage terminase small subunit [Paenibacillaceae bacterium WGS1546]|uniref:phage terminase small subunit n=1 Tax=Cohnella sp. WGS1546 TaxID=3366810 RepID=UPI00372D5589